VLRWIVESRSDNEIASNLGIEPGYVDELLNSVMHKLGTESREETIDLARREGWA
jgi:DNA-binding CsgD family transcriptional regulator